MTDAEYSPVSSLAVASSILGVLSVAGFATPEFVLFAAVGAVCGAAALVGIHKYELGGRRLATVGTVLSAAFVVVTPSWHFARYRWEALPDYERVHFGAMTRAEENRLDELIGRKVCLKGYVLLPDDYQVGVRSFLLSPNGDRSKPESAVLVRLPAGETWLWQHEAQAVSGRLVRNPDADEDDPDSPKFILQRSWVRTSRTRYGLDDRASYGSC